MLYYIGLFLLSHLLVGFIIGIKHVFVSDTYKEIKNFREDKDIISDEDYEMMERTEKLFETPFKYICLITLSGYIALYTELQILGIEIKYFFKRLKRKISIKRRVSKTKSLTKKIEKFNKKYGTKE